METVEQKTADAILQKSNQVVIGGVTYEVAPPSTATLILVSELVSKLPRVDISEENVVTGTLKIAKDCRLIGEIIATLILGAKELSNSLLPKYKLKKLADKLLIELGPKALSELALGILQRMETADFFGLTVFLIEINLTKATRETVT